MTNYTYKIIIFDNGLYREVQLKDDFEDYIKIGTTKNCKVRFDKKKFFDDFEIEIYKENTVWKASCYNSIYIDSDSVLKSHSIELYHGIEVTFKYEFSNSKLFKIAFLIDFDDEDFDFRRVIDVSLAASFEIGSSEYHTIILEDDLVGEDSITLTRQGEKFVINDNNTKFGVYINGRKINDKTGVVCPYDFFMLDGYYFYYKSDRLYTSAAANIISKLPETIIFESKNQFNYPKFNRNVRMKIAVPNEKISILPPKDLSEPPEKNLAMTLIPSIISLVVMMLLRSMMGGNKMFLIYCGMTMGMGIITSIVTYFSQGKKYRQYVAKREIEYTDYVKKQEKKIKQLRTEEHRIMCEKYIDLDTEIQRVIDFDSTLFEKSKLDDDFLTIRLGAGEIEAKCEIDIKEQEFKNLDDKIADYPTIIRDAYRTIKASPIILDLKECNGIGIVGPRPNLFELLKNITVDIVTRHFYDDVKLYYIFSEKDIEKFKPFRWLKHVGNQQNSIRNFMYNDESKKIMLEYLYKELSRRDGMKPDMIREEPHHVIFVYDSRGFANHPVSNYVEQGETLGFTFIFLDEYQEYLPEHINYVIYSEEISKGRIVDVKDRETVQDFTYNILSESELEALCLKLGCVEVDAVSLENNLTSSISLFKLLGIMGISDIDLGELWQKSQIYKTMAAPLGVNANNEIVYLDLNEKKHGPHGLVAGTTGSGKSEILQSYILSMAIHYHPYEVGFVIIDFKGGGMVNQFKNLPHLIGAITNIDGREIERSLLSIRAELKKRQTIFAEYNVNHIDSYIKLYKSGKAEKPLPHLILIVDEFAELKNEHSEFMKELISAARIGRSLGVHLILATQKPTGVVDNQIWSNSKFKLCLKVQDKSDSNEVLKSPLAAEIKEPGRAYLQVGNNEIFELFQSAFSGADVDEQQTGKMKEYEVAKLNLAGMRNIIFKQKNNQTGESKNQLEVTVDYINEFCKTNNIEQLQGICLPSLNEIIDYQYVVYEKSESVGMIPGIYDDPENQYQGFFELNLSMNHVFILGSAQYGKTNLLQVIIKGLVCGYSPEQVNIYILDFASMILKNLSKLKHIGGVVTASEDEKIKHFFLMMNQEVAHRKSVLAELGISSFSSYLEAGYSDLCQIVIIIDNFTVLKELYLQKEDLLLPICRDGISVGISIICTDSQSSGLGYRYLSNFSKKIALFTNNEGEYNNLFGFCRMKNRNIPGRAIVEIDKTLYEFQSFLAFKGKKEIERVADMKEFVEEINKQYGEIYAKRIPEIPKSFTQQFARINYPDKFMESNKFLYGINYKSVEPESINLMEMGLLGITGKEKYGKGNFVRNLIASLERNKQDFPYNLYVIDDMMGKFKEFKTLDDTKLYSIGADAVLEAVDEFDIELDKLYTSLPEGNTDLSQIPFKLLLIQNRDAMDVLSKSKEHMDKIKNIIGKYGKLKVAILLSNIENAPIGFTSSEILKLLKEKKNIIFFENVGAFKAIEIPNTYIKEFSKPIELGDGYRMNTSGLIKCRFMKA